MVIDSIVMKLNTIGLLVTDHITAMLAYWDKDLVCRFANAAYLDWFGKTKEEMIDKITLDKLLGPLFEANSPYIYAALKGEKQTFEREIITPNGEKRHSLANYIPDIEDAQTKGFFVHVADISEIKTLELRLIETNKIINEQNKSLLNFANIVTHNLRSYSSSLSGLIELTENTIDEEKKIQMFEHIKQLSKRFSATISNLNEVIDKQNHTSLEPKLINLHQYVNNTIDIIKTQITASNAIVNNCIEKNFELRAIGAYLESILLNLLTNALKYKHSDRAPVITINAEQTEDEIIISIADNGMGIDLNRHRKDLFGMYKVFHGNPDSKGIGLYLVKYHVESMGGRIEVESKLGIGTTFTIFLKNNHHGY